MGGPGIATGLGLLLAGLGVSGWCTRLIKENSVKYWSKRLGMDCGESGKVT